MRLHSIPLLASPLFLLTLACGQSVVETPLTQIPNSAVPLEAPAVARVAFDSAFVLAARYSGIGDRRRVVIRDAAAWSAAWAELHAPSQPVEPAPNIDFATYMIVFVTMGSKATGGFEITIDDVREADAAVYASVTERSPGRSCITTQGFTYPVAARLVPRRASATRFIERTEVYHCD